MKNCVLDASQMKFTFTRTEILVSYIFLVDLIKHVMVVNLCS